MDTAYPLTLSPLQIGRLTIKNRVARTAHATFLTADGTVGDPLIRYHLARAEGGVGLSLLEGGAVHPGSRISLKVYDDSVIAGYERLARALEPTGMKILQQLWHGGHVFLSADGSPPVAPSAVASHIAGVAPAPLTGKQIGELVASYAAAAVRCEKGGLNGVEVHAGHGYLISQFLSPVLNLREDAYGGDLENRMRFLLEILRAVRAAVSPDFVVGVRLSDSADPKVLAMDEIAIIAARLERERLVDYVNASYGDYYANQRQLGGMEVSAGFQLPHTAPPVAGLSIPRLLNGRFRALAEIEAALQAGSADIISMVRAHIADPDIVAKTLAGHPERVRPCIACNQGCVAQAATPGRIGCVVNPAAGEEATLSDDTIAIARAPRRVLIVGGGPAGLEAARVAALGGHQVILAEAEAALGGRLNLCRLAPNMSPMGELARWLEGEVRRLGVDVRLATRLDVESAAALGPDHVVVAIGADDTLVLTQVLKPADPLSADGGPPVLTTRQLLTTNHDLGRRAIVVDEFGHYEGIACAEHLLAKGLSVTYVTRHKMFAPAADDALRTQSALERLYACGAFALRTGALVERLTPEGALVAPLFGGRPEAIAADVVVWIPVRPGQHALAAALEARGVPARTVGDALAGRELQMAIREGRLAARAIDIAPLETAAAV